MRKETIAIVVAVFALCVLLVNAVSADSIISVPSSIAASKTFDTPKDTTPSFTTSTSFTIQNTVNKTVTYTVSDITTEPGITVSSSPSSGTIAPDGSASVSLTLTLSSSLSEGVHTGRVMVVGDGEAHTIEIRITIMHKAKLEISPTPVSFDKISASGSTTKQVTFSETLGYKSIVVSLEKSTGNGWVTTSSNSFTVAAGKSEPITFRIAPSGVTRDNCDRYYSWTYRVSSTEGAGSYTLYLTGELCCPAKLSYDSSSSTTIAFNRPKTDRYTYHATAKIKVSNTGCEQLRLQSPYVTSSSGSITLSVEDYPVYISGYSSDYIELAISAPYDAPEGTYYGTLYIDAGDAGNGEVDITIVIKWPVDFSISPTSIDFGSIELEERGYETKQVNITIREFYYYKPVRNLRFSVTGEYGTWLEEELDFTVIPPGESRTVTIKIEPGLEAVPKDYAWTYAVSASEIAAKRMEVKAKIVPLNITKLIEGFQSFQGTPLQRDYPSSDTIIANGIAMLEVVESSEISAEDWQKIPVLMTGTLSLLSSLNDGIVFTEAANYGNAVESLSSASVSTATIESNADLDNKNIAGYATDIAADAGTTTEAVLRDEAKLLELRGWTLKKAVEHALAIGDISSLQEEENVLEAALSYQYAAMLYGLLNDKEKRLENVYEGSVLMDGHDELVSDATDLRIRAENTIATSRENDLTRIGDWYVLLNPYNYDTFVTSYKTAESYLGDAVQDYQVAGERFLYDQTEEELTQLRSELSSILFLFFFACSLYGLLFIYAITRIARGTTAYLRDVNEREVGELLVTRQ
jgi:hypothetical protein